MEGLPRRFKHYLECHCKQHRTYQSQNTELPITLLDYNNKKKISETYKKAHES